MHHHATADDVIRRIADDAAERTGVDAANWQIVSEQPMQWTDTSLGVREPGMMYGRIMIPGHRVVVSDGTRELVYHTGRMGAFVFSREQAQRTVTREIS